MLSLGSFALAENVDAYSSTTYSIASQPYTLNLTTAECAFSYSDCLPNIDPTPFLTITFSTRNDTLLANDDIVFPSPEPMQFQAVRHWGERQDKVTLAYTLDMQALPHQPEAIPGDLYSLIFTLVDLQGRSAIEHPLSVGVVRDSDSSLHLVQVEESEEWLEHHLSPSPEEQTNDRWSWWNYRAWKTFYHGRVKAYERTRKTNTESRKCKSAGKGSRPTRCKHSHSHLKDWSQRNYLRLLRPVLTPGVIGLFAGFLAFVVGYIIAGLAVAAFYSIRDKVRGRTSRENIEAMPEKQPCMASYEASDSRHSF
ncbi:hypothetical protein BDV18DRAFT_158219 [Aspergillus unguis]